MKCRTAASREGMMLNSQSASYDSARLPTEALRELHSLFSAIESALIDGKPKVALELCRSGRPLVLRLASRFERELSAAEFQDLLQQAAGQTGVAG